MMMMMMMMMMRTDLCTILRVHLLSTNIGWTRTDVMHYIILTVHQLTTNIARIKTEAMNHTYSSSTHQKYCIDKSEAMHYTYNSCTHHEYSKDKQRGYASLRYFSSLLTTDTGGIVTATAWFAFMVL